MSEERRQSRRRTSIRRGGKSAAQQRPHDPERFTRVSLAPDVRQLLQQYGLQPQRGFGQNFLVDPFVLERILEAAEVGANDQILEIGPGLGILTRALVERARQVVAVEIDRGMVVALRDMLGDRGNLDVIEGDALEFDPVEVFGSSPYKLVANLPFYITSALLRHFFESENRPTRVVVMVQFEVAERMTASIGDLNQLAIGVQYYGRPRVVGRIPATAFHPKPKVDSAIVAIDVYSRPAVEVPPQQFFATVTAGFGMPRKQLHNALSQRIWFPPGGAQDVLAAAGIDSARRAQTLSLEEWANLANELQRRGSL